MNFLFVTFCMLLCIAVAPVAAQENAATKEENCRLAIISALEQLRRVPPEAGQRDDDYRRRLLADMERLVEDNRRAGVSECRIWGQLMGKAFNQ